MNSDPREWVFVSTPKSVWSCLIPAAHHLSKGYLPFMQDSMHLCHFPDVFLEDLRQGTSYSIRYYKILNYGAGGTIFPTLHVVTPKWQSLGDLSVVMQVSGRSGVWTQAVWVHILNHSRDSVSYSRTMEYVLIHLRVDFSQFKTGA